MGNRTVCEGVPEGREELGQMQECSATPGHDPLLDGREGGVLGVLDPQLPVLQLHLCCCSHLPQVTQGSVTMTRH